MVAGAKRNIGSTIQNPNAENGVQRLADRQASDLAAWNKLYGTWNSDGSFTYPDGTTKYSNGDIRYSSGIISYSTGQMVYPQSMLWQAQIDAMQPEKTVASRQIAGSESGILPMAQGLPQAKGLPTAPKGARGLTSVPNATNMNGLNAQQNTTLLNSSKTGGSSTLLGG